MNIDDLTNEEIEELVGFQDTDNDFLKVRENRLFLSDNQVNTLKKYNINADHCKTMTELLYMIEESGGEDEELDYLAEQLAERNYYENTNK